MPFMRVISIITITTAIIATTTIDATLFTHFWDAKADAWKRATTEVLSFSLHRNNKKSVCVKSNWWIDTDYTNSWELHVSSKCVCFPVAVLQSCLCRCQQQQKQQQKRCSQHSEVLFSHAESKRICRRTVQSSRRSLSESERECTSARTAAVSVVQ